MSGEPSVPDSGEQASLDALPDGVVVSGADGRVTVLNAAARRMLGEQARVGDHLRDVVALEDQSGQEWYAENDPYDGISTRVAFTEQSWLLPDGTETLVTGRLERSAARGPVTRVALVLRSGRGRERLDRERSDLVATVAHELRSPLTGVKGFVTTLLRNWDRLNDEQKKLMLTTVHTDADRLSVLITELLDVARIDTGRLRIYRRPVAARDVVEAVVASVSAGTSRVIEAAYAADVPQIYADPDKLAQVVTNLLENAIRHGEGTVRVSLSAISEPFPGARLVVEDQGEGIAESARRRVFTKFWTRGGEGGSGLGLYLVHGLTRAHGGVVRIGDAEGGGARLEVDWPTEEHAG